MFKRLVSFILIFVVSLFLLPGCSSTDSGKSDSFDAEKFVDECKILMPASLYKDSELKDFEINFTTTVFKEFGKSDYYKSMSDSEREDAINALGKVLETLSYGNATEGFVNNFRINKLNHTVLWNVKGYTDAEVMWNMPGY